MGVQLDQFLLSTISEFLAKINYPTITKTLSTQVGGVFVIVGVEGFEWQRPTAPDLLL
jgi:hypothetical protein